MLASTWVLVAVRLNIQLVWTFFLATLVAGIYSFSSYNTYAELLQVQLDKRVRVFNSGRYWAWSIPIAESTGVVEQAIALNIYTPPPRPLPKADIYVLAETTELEKT